MVKDHDGLSEKNFPEKCSDYHVSFDCCSGSVH